MLQKQSFLTVLLLFSFIAGFAQHGVVTGVVRDEKGKPMEQAVVAD